MKKEADLKKAEEEARKKEEEARKKLQKEAELCFEQNTKNYKLGKTELAHGSYGSVYLVCDVIESKKEEKCNKIVKIVLNGDPKLILKEINIWYLLHDSGLTPTLYEIFHCGIYLFIIMEKFDTNMEVYAEHLFQQHKYNLRYLEGSSFPWERRVYKEKDLIKMFEIARDLGVTHDVIHADLKPDQYLLNLLTGKIAVTDFGKAGTSDGKIPAKRGWTWKILTKCSYDQPLPPNVKDVLESTDFRAYFNLFQLWESLAFSNIATTAVLLDKPGKGGTPEYAYLSSQIYPFEKGHPLYIPPNIIEFFTKLENQYADVRVSDVPAHMRNLVRECHGKEAPQTAYFPASRQIRPWRVAAAAA